MRKVLIYKALRLWNVPELISGILSGKMSLPVQ